jgi:hypothetical protein
MSTIPEGITLAELQRYAKIQKQLEKLNPVLAALDSKVRAAYLGANEGIDKKKTIVVDEIGAVVTLQPKTALDTQSFLEDYSPEDFPQFFKTVPDKTAIQKDEQVKAAYYKDATPAFSFNLTD